MKRLMGVLITLVVLTGGITAELTVLIDQLAADEFAVRIGAEKKLRALPSEKISALQIYLESDDVEIRSRVKAIIQYIRDHAPQGVTTLQSTIVDVNTDAERRAKAIKMLCVMVGNVDEEAINVLAAVASRPTLGVTGDKGRYLQGQIMTEIQGGLHKLGDRAADEPDVVEGLIACLKQPSLCHYAIRGLGHAAGLGNQKALKTVLEPGDYGMTLSSTISTLREPVAKGNKVIIAALGDAVGSADKGGLLQIAVTLQTAGVPAYPLVVPVLEKLLNKSAGDAVGRRAVMVLETMVARNPDLKSARDLLAEWQPKVKAVRDNRIRARASTTIKIQP